MFAIKYIGKDPLFICSSVSSSGYDYCCLCKDTQKFMTEAAARTFMVNMKVSSGHHEIKPVKGKKNA